MEKRPCNEQMTWLADSACPSPASQNNGPMKECLKVTSHSGSWGSLFTKEVVFSEGEGERALISIFTACFAETIFDA